MLARVMAYYEWRKATPGEGWHFCSCSTCIGCFIKSCAAARTKQFLSQCLKVVELAHPSDLCCFHGKEPFLHPPLFITSSTPHAAHFGSQHAMEAQKSLQRNPDFPFPRPAAITKFFKCHHTISCQLVSSNKVIHD